MKQILKPLKIRIQKLLNTGVAYTPDVSFSKYILRSNYITLTVLVLIIPYGLLFYFLGGELQGLLLAIAWFLFLPVYFFNRKGRFVQAKLWLLGMVIVCVGYFGAVFGHDSSVQYVFYVFVTMPFLLFPLRQPQWLAVTVLAFIAAFYSLELEWFQLKVVLAPPAQHVLHLAIISLVLVWITANYLYFEYSNQESENRLKAYNAKLEAKNKELEQFAYIASHDLQEPLLTVGNFTQMLQDEQSEKLDDNGLLYVKFIANASARMRELVKGLMDYSRLGGQKELQRVNTNELIMDVLADLNHSIERNNAAVQFAGLPTIMAYETELRLLFQNLIGNALKFSKPGVSPQIFVSAERAINYWQFAVKDNGIGIKEQFLEKIFIIFQRLHDRDDYEGTGIGLAHCRKIVELHGGKIWAESTPGEGSTFYFTLPI